MKRRCECLQVVNLNKTKYWWWWIFNGHYDFTWCGVFHSLVGLLSFSSVRPNTYLMGTCKTLCQGLERKHSPSSYAFRCFHFWILISNVEPSPGSCFIILCIFKWAFVLWWGRKSKYLFFFISLRERNINLYNHWRSGIRITSVTTQ